MMAAKRRSEWESGAFVIQVPAGVDGDCTLRV
jgi:hypothetical protein